MPVHTQGSPIRLICVIRLSNPAFLPQPLKERDTWGAPAALGCRDFKNRQRLLSAVRRYKLAPLQANTAKIVPRSAANPKVNSNANIRTDSEAAHCCETSSMPVAKYPEDLAVPWSRTERKKVVTEVRKWGA
jgi:hypothetical protein